MEFSHVTRRFLLMPGEFAIRSTTRIGLFTRRVTRWAAAYWLTFLTIFHFPGEHIPKIDSLFQVDKIVHFFGYGLMTLFLYLVVWPYGRTQDRDRRWLLVRAALVFAAIVVHGLIDEFTQPFTNRSFEWYDLVADSAGSIVSLILVSRLTQRAWFERCTQY